MTKLGGIARCHFAIWKKDPVVVLTMTRSFARVLQDLAPLKAVAAPFKMPPRRFSVIWHRRHDADRAHATFRDLIAKICVERFGAASDLATRATMAVPDGIGGRHGCHANYRLVFSRVYREYSLTRTHRLVSSRRHSMTHREELP